MVSKDINSRAASMCARRATLVMLAWVCAGTNAWAQKSLGALPATAVPTPTPALAPTTVPKGSLPLDFRPSTSPLTVGEMAALQRKKLEQDYYKKAGFTTEKPPLAPPKSFPVTKGTSKAAPARARHQLVVVGVYGPIGNERAEVRYDGILHVVAGRARVGLITFESLAPGVVHVLAEHTGRPGRFVLRPGQTLEVSE